jgi:hypothetical protein
MREQRIKGSQTNGLSTTSSITLATVFFISGIVLSFVAVRFTTLPNEPNLGPESLANTRLDDDFTGDVSLQELHRMVMSTNGYFVRDYSLWLGWNNVSCPRELEP